MQDKRLVPVDLDQFGQVFLGLFDVDIGVFVVAEDAEIAVDADVHARGLEQGRVVWIDADSALVQ
jgi:hypothetical protein